MAFQPAQRSTAKARIGIAGPSGSGKTWTALAIAKGLVGDDGRIAFADTERGSASLYAGDFNFDVDEFFPPFTTKKYLDAINAAADAGYDVLIIDSITHAWKGEGGVLDEVDAAKARNRGGNDFAAWKDGDKLWRGLLDAILGAPIHVIVTMRSKQEWVLEEDDRGRKVPRKLGMAPEARDGIEYEFTLVFDMDHTHTAVVSKTRCSVLADAVIHRPDHQVGETLSAWLNSGVPSQTPQERAGAALARVGIVEPEKVALVVGKYDDGAKTVEDLPPSKALELIDHLGYESVVERLLTLVGAAPTGVDGEASGLPWEDRERTQRQEAQDKWDRALASIDGKPREKLLAEYGEAFGDVPFSELPTVDMQTWASLAHAEQVKARQKQEKAAEQDRQVAEAEAAAGVGG